MRRTRSTADVAKTPASGRVAAILAAAAILVFAPGIAQAAFNGSDNAQMNVGTLNLPAPTGASVTATCTSPGPVLLITVTSYGNVPRATSYEFTVLDPNGTAVPAAAGTYTTSPAAKGKWTYQIRGLYTVSSTNVWKGQPFQGTVRC
ncbi:hypothetical protein [Arthrobacter bambusae]|uniref:hypothetical protein n=1 Tax=Arthrobacter bambusae TaxID=1338426 RepID=UPI00277DE9B3|nr:hypothetical protein [Arthrobacter bambusae]MDQ0032173.1 hypothetical protein [Arthrobacter bambusae]MDQ0100291.1 hypothetical protein [Arthrobacter bambusae]